jgi:transglutaminase-like putative cysteine protease
MLFRIRHATRFSYEKAAYQSHNEIRLVPRTSPRQRCLEFRLETNVGSSVVEFRDSFANIVHSVSMHQPHKDFQIVAESIVERNPPRLDETAQLPFDRYLADDASRTLNFYEFLSPTTYVPFSDRLRRFFWSARPDPHETVAEYVTRIVIFVRDQFGYEPGTTDAYSDVDQMLSAGGGVCQDFSHLTLGVLRLAGVPARYVSGYLAPDPKVGFAGEQATHAWLEAMLPDAGWTGFDPTHRGRTTDQHIRVALGRDYSDATPLRGVFRSSGGNHSMSIDLKIERLSADSTEFLKPEQSQH